MDLTAAYDTVWHQGLTLKLLQTSPDRYFVHFIINILSKRSFKLKTSAGQISRLCILKNGSSQGSTPSPIQFNIYIGDIPTTVSHQYGYADDMALLYFTNAGQNLKKRYLEIWRTLLTSHKPGD